MLHKRLGNFDPVNHRAVEQDIIVTLKPRQVIVLSNDKLNQSNKFEYVQVLPVFGLTNRNARQVWYKDLKRDSHPGFVYINRGENGFAVDLTQVSTIHKRLLLKRQSKVPIDRMEFIEAQLLELLDL